MRNKFLILIVVMMSTLPVNAQSFCQGNFCYSTSNNYVNQQPQQPVTYQQVTPSYLNVTNKKYNGNIIEDAWDLLHPRSMRRLQYDLDMRGIHVTSY